MVKISKKAQLPRRPGENGFRYSQQFGLVIVCRTELEQRRLFARLTKLGLAPKVVCV
ncbi:MAG: hypothetical protein IAE86_06460 [Burkholderiaceae bacterium]|nr:hypothetical protein [Burkholderiaceae bacterium]